MVHRQERALDDLVTEMQASGLRATTARRAVLGVLLAAGERHLAADELATLVHRDHPAIHLSTIYRTLDALADADVIVPARFGDSPATYHLADDRHHHAVCTSCGATLQLPATVLEPMRKALRREYGFRADPRHLTIPGLCQSCAG